MEVRLKSGVGTVKVEKLNGKVLDDLRKLLHDPSLTMRGVMLSVESRHSD